MNYNGLEFEYSLLTPPRILNGYLILDINGSVVNPDAPPVQIDTFALGKCGCIHLPIKPKQICLRQICAYAPLLPEYFKNGKLVQMFVSD